MADPFTILDERDITTDTSASVLEDLVKDYINNTWIVLRMMLWLKQQDPYLDFRIHYDDNDEVDAVLGKLDGVGLCLRFIVGKFSFMSVRLKQLIPLEYVTFPLLL